jgi:hypothetical protein
MGINARSSLDPRWVSHHVAVTEGFMVATIKFIRKNPDVNPTYDQATETWTGGFDTIWTGPARVQPYGIIGDQIVAQDATGRRLMRVQIADKTADIKLDDMGIVIDSPYDTQLMDYTLEVRGSIGSSNSWVRDLVCEADLKR